jgi:hypothetical protein
VNQTLQDVLEKLDPDCDECRSIAEQYQPDLIPAARQALVDIVVQHLKWQHRMLSSNGVPRPPPKS